MVVAAWPAVFTGTCELGPPHKTAQHCSPPLNTNFIHLNSFSRVNVDLIMVYTVIKF